MLSKNVNKTLNLLNKQIAGLKYKFAIKNFFTMNNNLKGFSLKGVSANCSLPGLNFSRKNFADEKTIDMPEQAEIIESNKESLGFKAETKKLLDIVTHSLYTDKEIFLRELLSNCSDALEKQRFFEVTGQLPMIGEPLYISISTNEKNKTITIFDSGVGMTREELIENLGTIAKSGTQSFLKNVKEKKGENNSGESLIGQFGVGFYSSFIVGDVVEVTSKTQNSTKGHHWISDGNGEFQISDVENVDFKRGTKVVIHLKTECRDFCKASELQKIIKKYSNFISYTIKLNGEVVNSVQAIWYREKKDVSSEEYQKFFEHVSNNKMPYKYLLHFSSDVPLDIKAVLFFPSQSMEKYGITEENTGLSLYSKKILIKAKCTELVPNYFRFVKGVVDCADIPLSISRENYQDSSLIFKLRVLITKRIIKKLEDEMKLDPENYDKWYEDFSQYLREGVLSDSDNAEPLLRLLRFKVNVGKNREKGSLETYLKKIKPGQEKVYYLNILGNEREIDDNVFLENFKENDLPILICSSPLDEMIFKQVGQYKNMKFLNLENESDDYLNQFKQESSSSLNKLPEEDITPFTLWIKNELEPFVSKVSISKRLKDSPILVTSQMSSQMKMIMTMMNAGGQTSSKDYHVEINPSHEFIVNLNKLRKEDPKIASQTIKQAYDTTLIQSGIPLQNNDFAKRSFSLLKTLINDRLKIHQNESEGKQEPVERIKTETLKDFKDDVKLKNSDIFADFKLNDNKK
jgi:TNF receptor-associated protein 1